MQQIRILETPTCNILLSNFVKILLDLLKEPKEIP